MLEAEPETVATSFEVSVFECSRCNVVYFTEDHLQMSGPSPQHVRPPRVPKDESKFG